MRSIMHQTKGRLMTISSKKKTNYSPVVVTVLVFIVGQLLLFNLNASWQVQILYAVGFVGLFVAGSRYHNYVFIYRVMIPIVVGLVFISIYREAHNIQPVSKFFSASLNQWKYLDLLFSVLSTLYAICTAFLLWKGLTDHDELRKLLREEANEIQRIIGFMHYFDLGERKNTAHINKMRENFLVYVKNIVRGDRVEAHIENYQILRKSIDSIANIKVVDANDQIALAEIMKGLSDLIMMRSRRISQMEIKMSPYILASLAIMSLAILYPFFTEKPEVVQQTIIMILSGILSFLLMTLLDISQPFDGFWKIKVEAFDDILQILENEIEEANQED